VSDTPTPYCPDCAPEADEVAEHLYRDYCGTHRRSLAGLDDAKVIGAPWSPYTWSEVESEGNRAACALIHRPEETP
jgi:hypothetical protein